MFSAIWHDVLYQPLFNLLIWIYNNWTDENLGWAVIIMTLLMRLVLLPFTLINERNRIRNLELLDEVRHVEKTYQADPVMKKEEIRRVMKKRRVQPWSTAIVLFVHALVFLLLYQVFISGIKGTNLFGLLYSSVDYPGRINTDFYGFQLGQTHDIIWPGLVALFLAAEIYIGYRHRRGRLRKTDLFYFILFPLIVFFVLWALPMVKSLFIMATMVFSILMALTGKLLFRRTKAG